MHHSDFIAMLTLALNPTIYVELGLYHGETLKKVINNVGMAYGVDMTRHPKLEKLENRYKDKINISYTTTDEFFKTFATGIDMAFIDAEHVCEGALRDFENVWKLLNNNGIILMHDTDPEDNSFFNPGYCGDSYKIVKLFEGRDDMNIITLPISEAGLSIIMKKNSSRTFLRNGPSIYEPIILESVQQETTVSTE